MKEKLKHTQLTNSFSIRKNVKNIWNYFLLNIGKVKLLCVSTLWWHWPCKFSKCLCLFDIEWHNSSFVSWQDLMWTRVFCCYLIQRMNVVSVPEGGCFSLSLLCLLRTTQPWGLGPWDPKSLDIRGLWDSASCTPPLPPPPHFAGLF